MTGAGIWLLLAALAMPLRAGPADTGEIVFLTHLPGPFTFVEDGRLQGFAVDLVLEMMDRAGHSRQLVIYPFKRALWTVQHRPRHALFIVARRPEREKTIKWVRPLISSSVYFYRQKDSRVRVNTLDDVRRLTAVGVGLGNADDVYLHSLGFTNIHQVENQLQSIRMLHYGRIDVTPVSELAMPWLAAKAGIDPADLERTDVRLYDSVLYLAFSLDVPDTTVARWQRALDELKDSGRLDAIGRRCFPRMSTPAGNESPSAASGRTAVE